LTQKQCQNCKKKFIAKRENAKFCSSTCRVKAWKKKNEVKAEVILNRLTELEKRIDALEKPHL